VRLAERPLLVGRGRRLAEHGVAECRGAIHVSAPAKGQWS
jgi:hypothetical protein